MDNWSNLLLLFFVNNYKNHLETAAYFFLIDFKNLIEKHPKFTFVFLGTLFITLFYNQVDSFLWLPTLLSGECSGFVHLHSWGV